jgi:hypothetical protein
MVLLPKLFAPRLGEEKGMGGARTAPAAGAPALRAGGSPHSYSLLFSHAERVQRKGAPRRRHRGVRRKWRGPGS